MRADRIGAHRRKRQPLPFPPMNPQTEIDLLRSQLADARKQLEADSQTIAKLAKDKRELFAESAELLNAITLWIEADMRQAPPNAESMAAFFLPTFCKNAHNFLSRHA